MVFATSPDAVHCFEKHVQRSLFTPHRHGLVDAVLHRPHKLHLLLCCGLLLRGACCSSCQLLLLCYV